MVEDIEPVVHEMGDAKAFANRRLIAALPAKMNMAFRYTSTLRKLMMRHPEPCSLLNPWASF